MATARHPHAKERKDGREAENEERDAKVREGWRPRVGVDSRKDDATTSQHDGQRDRKRNCPPNGAAREQPKPSQSGPPFKVGFTIRVAACSSSSPLCWGLFTDLFQALARFRALCLRTARCRPLWPELQLRRSGRGVWW